MLENNDRGAAVNHITLFGTASPYGLGANIEKKLASFIKANKSIYSYSIIKGLDKDHVSNSVIRDAFNISRERGGSVFVDPNFHKALGSMRTYQVPEGFGYENNTGGVLDIIEYFKGLDLKNIDTYCQTPEGLLLPETMKKQLSLGYEKAYGMDLKLVEKERLGDDISQNEFLAISDVTLTNQAINKDLNMIQTRLAQNPSTSIEQAVERIDKTFTRYTVVRNHTRAVKGMMPPNTRARAEVARVERQALNTAQGLIEYVKDRGGKTDQQIQEDFFSPKSEAYYSPEEASKVATSTLGLRNYKNKPASKVGPTLFTHQHKTE